VAVTQFAEALRQLMADRGLSQRQLAERIGVTPSAVNFWAQGTSRPTRGNVIALEDELAVQPRGWLLNLADYRADSEPAPTVESLIRADPGLDPEDKRVLLRIVANARERYAPAREALTPDLRDPDEAEIWGLKSYSEDERRQLIQGLRDIRAQQPPRRRRIG
jgi:transcriptional regulator with XRE-family HTH domain